MNYECLLFILGIENYLITEYNILFPFVAIPKWKNFEMRNENTCVRGMWEIIWIFSSKSNMKCDLDQKILDL